MGALTARPTLARTLATALMAALTSVAAAQSEPEYRAEIGVGAGLQAYYGDFNANLLKGFKPAVAALAKYRFNPRMALALNVSYGKLEGSSDNTATWYPAYDDAPMDFSTSLVDVGLRFEYNFWPYGTGREYFGARRFTPYIGIGLGATIASSDAANDFTVNVPIGVGVKYKIAQRVNVALEWAMHFSMSDELDGVADPYGIKSNGAFKNTDCYSMLQLSVTYDIWMKCRTCHNDDF